MMNKTTFTEEAAKKGWKCDWRPESDILYRLSGVSRDGIRWQLESGGQRGQSKWVTEDARLVENQYISFSQWKPPPRFSLTRMINAYFFKRRLAKVMAEDDAEPAPGDDELAVIYHLELQTPPFREHCYKLFVTDLDENFVRRVFDGEVEQALLSWFTGRGKGRFNKSVLSEISIENSVEFEAHSNLTEIPTIEQFVELGLTVARKVRKAQAAS